MFSDRWLDQTTETILNDLLYAMGNRDSLLDQEDDDLVAGLRRAVRGGLVRNAAPVAPKPRRRAVGAMK